jgi:TPR repeat protein
MTKETMQIYTETANHGTHMGVVKKARVEAARIVIYEGYGDDHDKIQIYNWLTELITDRTKFPNGASEVFELLGYCLENGIGTMKDKDAAIQFYIDCINEDESKDLAKQRSLCRLVYNCMEHRNYVSAYTYLELLKPSFDDLDKINSADARRHARCMKYYLGKHVTRNSLIYFKSPFRLFVDVWSWDKEKHTRGYPLVCQGG